MARTGMVLLAVIAAFAAFGSAAQDIVFVSAHEVIPITPENQDRFMLPGDPPIRLKSGGVNYSITYMDVVNSTGAGFDHPTLGAPRRATADAALQYILGTLNVNTGANIDVLFELSIQNSSSSTLASGGTYFFQTPGFTNGFAFQHLTTGTDPSGQYPDIFATVNFGRTWNSNHTQEPTSTQFDLYSVLVHEYTHGLGIVSLSNSNGTSAIHAGAYSYWDGYIARSNGTPLFAGSPPAFTGTSSDLISNNLICLGAHATTTQDGAAPRIYAPNPWSGGSSLSHWDFNHVDGVMVHQIPPGKKYPTYYSVDLAALKDIGYTTALSGPTADFVAPQTVGEVPFTVAFSDTTDPGSAAIASYLWQFGDGATSTAANPTHTYAATGTYTVTLTTTTSIAKDATRKTGYINVLDQSVAPVADFTSNPIWGIAPLTVAFTNLSTPGTQPITGWLWDFGDGATSTDQNPTHVYEAPGAYAVSLQATSAAGSDVATRYGQVVVWDSAEVSSMLPPWFVDSPAR